MKKYLEINVYDAAVQRIEYIFSRFEKVYVSFSGGKDSGILLNIAIDVATRMGRLPVHVLVIDMEAQYRRTVDYVERMLDLPSVTAHWVCLPIHLRNAVSQFQPHWLCWDPDKQSAWVRPLPVHRHVVSDETLFPFFRRGIEFEEFVPLYGDWLASGRKTACLVGIRSDESLNRFRTIASESKVTFANKQWSTRITDDLYNFYPIYDWRTEDVWAANGKQDYDYNKIYDLMYMAGLTIHQMRLCQPYGDDQRKGLYLFKILEPETWAKVVARVEGANFGNRYVNTEKTVLGNYKVELPPGHTYESYANFLLDTMPAYLAEHYRGKIKVFMNWWVKEGLDVIPETADPKLEAKRKAPSWRRICKVLLKNDYWCKGLSFAQTKREMEKQMELITKYNEL